MSALAASVVLHPKLTQSLAVLATTIGRDKTYRLIQYLARLIAWALLRRGNIEASARWDGLKAGMASGRRVMRLFRPAEFMQSAMRLAGAPVSNLHGAGQLAHISQIARQVGFAGYYGFDMLVWLGNIRFLKFDKETINRYQTLSMKLWLFGIISSLVSSTSSFVKLRADSRRFMLSSEMARREAIASGHGGEKSSSSAEDRARDEEERRQKGRALLRQRQDILSQLIMDSLDVWIPATNLGYSNVNDGVLGVFGATTSYMALQKQWAKHSAAAARKSV